MGYHGSYPSTLITFSILLFAAMVHCGFLIGKGTEKQIHSPFFRCKKRLYSVLPVQSLIVFYFTVKTIKKLPFACLPDELEMQEYTNHFNPSEK
jgi:hypothetical protein